MPRGSGGGGDARVVTALALPLGRGAALAKVGVDHHRV